MRITSVALRATLSLVLSALLACAAAAQILLIDNERGAVLLREPLLPLTFSAAPLVVVIPGSGCERLDRSMHQLFTGLPGARVLLLQKPLLVHEPGAPCPAAFLLKDRHSHWLARASELARVAVQHVLSSNSPPGQLIAQTTSSSNWLLVGLSEGAELVPGLAQALLPTLGPATAWLIVGHSGLDPAEAGELQARRLGALERWQGLMQRAGAARAESAPQSLAEGRTLAYWADLHSWPLERDLLTASVPIVRVHGGADALMPEEAYIRFMQRAHGRMCAVRFDGLDHELRGRTLDGELIDGLQVLWQWVEEGWNGVGWSATPRCDRLRTLAQTTFRGGNFSARP